MNKYNIKREDGEKTLREIAQYMRHARKLKGYTQKELAEKMSVTSSRLSGIENARCGYTITFFISWCYHLDVNPLLVPRTKNPYTLQELLKVIAIGNPEEN